MGATIMKVYFLGAYSEDGYRGMMASSFTAREKAVSVMLAKVGGKIVSMSYLQGDFDVIAELELDSYETASGLKTTMMLSGGWDELLMLPEMDVDKAIEAAKKSGGYQIPGQE
jgi:uncharacterized protein with GYD domain